MANWNVLKAAVANIINANGNQEITGQLLQNVLNNIITNVGENATFAGIATLDTNPGAPDGPIFYLATTAGVYPNFNGLEVLDGEAIIFLWNNSAWTKKVTGFATQEKMQELEENTNEKLSQLGSEVAKFSNGSELIIKKIISSSKGVTNWINSFKQGVNYTFNVKFSNAVKVFVVTNINTGVDEIKYSGEPITEKNFVVDWKTTCPSVNVYVVTQNGESVNIDIQLLYKGEYVNVKDNAAAIARHENDINQNSINIKKNLVDVEKIKNGNNLVLKSFKSASGGTITWNNDFKKNEYYIFHISTDNPIKLFIVTNVNTGVNEIEYNGEPISEKDFVVNWKENCSSVIFYIKTEDGGTADVEVQLYNKRDYDNVKDNAAAIEKTDKEVETINKALGFKLFETEYNGLITKGSVLKFADYTFKYKETYLFQFECDDVVSVSFLKLHNINNADNGVSVKGKLNGESLLLTMDSDSKGVYVYSTLNEIFKCRIKVYRVTDLSQSDKTIYRTKNISIPSSQSVVTMQVINGLAPYLIKGLEYHISIELDSDVPINNGYFDVSWDDAYNGSSTQSIHITDYTSNLNGLDIAFIPLHNMAEVNMTLWLNALANDVNGKAYIYQKRNYVSVIDKMKYRSNVSAFLASYTISGEPGNLRLAISQDGLHFRKLSENAIFESGIGDGFQHDIAISKKDGYFYIIATTNVSDGLNAVFSLFRSKNLFQWEQCEDIKIPLSSFNYDEGNSYKSAWAPEILYLYGKYYFSFAICEKWTGSASGSILKAYIGELNDNFTSVSNIERISLNKDHADFAFDITIFHDTETNILYAYEHDGGVYRSKTGDFSEWTPVGCIPLTDYGYAYMEGGTILKVDGWFYIYGDGTIANSGKANNMLCWRTKDFTQYELVDKQFDKDIRHPKVITLDMLDTAIAQKVFIDNLFV